MPAIKKIIILLITVAAILIVGFFVYQNYIKGPTVPALPTSTQTNGIDLEKQRAFDEAVKKASATDKDLDGLSDSDEIKYKTDPNLADTDGDGLTDNQEILIYQTDPLKADTDGDGFADGYEVRRGNNPTGAGKIKLFNSK